MKNRIVYNRLQYDSLKKKSISNIKRSVKFITIRVF